MFSNKTKTFSRHKSTKSLEQYNHLFYDDGVQKYAGNGKDFDVTLVKQAQR